MNSVTLTSLALQQSMVSVQHLRFIVHDRRVRHKWSQYLPLVQRIINASFNTSIGTAPSKIIFGNRVNLDRHLVPLSNDNQSSRAARRLIGQIADRTRRLNVGNYITDLTEAQAAISAASTDFRQEQLKALSHSNRPTDALHSGEWVTASWGGGRRPNKLSVLWKGPYRVIGLKSGSGSVYICEDPADLVKYDLISH